ncbi:hypothetical protein [Fischerella thermalis]|uniref:hypothetical protein n=1 Tax=Fischerella thermalis TaxID=372787 RepID=UPI0019EB44A8|nr:hypothetical protein [Fischerella thermalis]MBF2069909.1 hypothetical protein [Fischerella thermalis M48_A2018_028]
MIKSLVHLIGKKHRCGLRSLHRKIANIRKDTLLNYYTLPKNHGTVVIEQSKGVKGMMAGITSRLIQR